MQTNIETKIVYGRKTFDAGKTHFEASICPNYTEINPYLLGILLVATLILAVMFPIHTIIGVMLAFVIVL